MTYNLIEGTNYDDTILGTQLIDKMRGLLGNDTLDGGEGNDIIRGHEGRDTLRGGEGDDYLEGGLGDDTVIGGNGNDQAWGGDGNDLVIGDAGDDQLYGGKGNDQLRGGDDNDVLYGDSGNDRLYGDAGHDTLIGGSGTDRMDGGAGNDFLDAGSGNDFMDASAGDDVYAGAAGFDSIDYTASGSLSISVDLHAGTVTKTEGADTLSGIERIVGTAGDDSFIGDKYVNHFQGNAGDDFCRGGADNYYGGTGHDTFQFLAKDVVLDGAHQGVDFIGDFTTSDTLDLHDILKGNNVNVSDWVQLSSRAGGSSSMLMVKVDGAFVEVAYLAGFKVMDVNAMAADGMIVF
jgi:Ca2+-binding RTX toxin-like protein